MAYEVGVHMPVYPYLARHGNIHGNAHARITGQIDSALSARGIQHQQALFRMLEAEPIVRIHTSALPRTWLTAAPLAMARPHPLHALEAFDELGFVIMEGINPVEIKDADWGFCDWWLEDPLMRALLGSGKRCHDLSRSHGCLPSGGEVAR